MRRREAATFPAFKAVEIPPVETQPIFRPYSAAEHAAMEAIEQRVQTPANRLVGKLVRNAFDHDRYQSPLVVEDATGNHIVRQRQSVDTAATGWVDYFRDVPGIGDVETVVVEAKNIVAAVQAAIEA